MKIVPHFKFINLWSYLFASPPVLNFELFSFNIIALATLISFRFVFFGFGFNLMFQSKSEDDKEEEIRKKVISTRW